jgi:hypothetical protein
MILRDKLPKGQELRQTKKGVYELWIPVTCETCNADMGMMAERHVGGYHTRFCADCQRKENKAKREAERIERESKIKRTYCPYCQTETTSSTTDLCSSKECFDKWHADNHTKVEDCGVTRWIANSELGTYKAEKAARDMVKNNKIGGYRR